MGKVKIGVLASGRGSNFKAILDEIKSGRCNAVPAVLITNNPSAGAIEIAKAAGVPVELIERKKFATREAMDDAILATLKKYSVELVVLAGYMLLLKGAGLFEEYKNRIINIHPALLPNFPGVDAQRQAFEAGAKISGVTIHLVDESLDGGPIIYQEKIDISDCKSAEEVSQKILKVEHKAYAKVIDSFSKGRYVIEGKNVKYLIGK